MELDIGIGNKLRQTVVKSLQALLIDEFALTLATRGAHWNVTGMAFGSLHELFGKQYEAIDEQVDEIAERIRSLGEKPESTLSAYVKAVRIKDNAGDAKDAQAMVKALLGAHENIIRQLRTDIGVAGEARDEGTADFLTGLLEAHEKTAWMLRAHLE